MSKVWDEDIKAYLVSKVKLSLGKISCNKILAEFFKGGRMKLMQKGDSRDFRTPRECPASIYCALILYRDYSKGFELITSS
jgi:hypothetical protein